MSRILFRVSPIVLFLALTGALLAAPIQQRPEQAKKANQEERVDYYAKWLGEDVRYIITPEEKAVFSKLQTMEEKEQFVEQFWHRRDPDFRTIENEFKEEHYRRIAYANEKFTWVKPGWLTDRGRIYILHGKPDQIEDHAGAGIYNRPAHEGGGYTHTYPFEIWRYRNIEGIGPDVELEFVDKCMCGNLELAKSPWEKDAMMEATPSLGPTQAELMDDELGPASRPYFDSESRVPGKGNYPLLQERYQDHPFVRYERYSRVQRPPEIKYRDLKEIVEINLSFDELPMLVRGDYFKLNEEAVLAPVTIEISSRYLDFKPAGEGFKASMGLYGIVTSLSRRIVNEFEDDLEIYLRPEELNQGRLKKASYQKILLLEAKMRYRLDLVLKDKTSGKAAVVRQALAPPKFEGEGLIGSSLLLSQKMELLQDDLRENDMFTLGDVKVLPSLDGVFSNQAPLGIYLQLYNFAIDQTQFKPLLDIQYRILKDSEVFLDLEDPQGGSIHYYSDTRVVLLKHLPIQSLPEGRYTVKVRIRDRVADLPALELTKSIQLTASR
jgi:GWxTD domain-containing protein